VTYTQPWAPSTGLVTVPNLTTYHDGLAQLQSSVAQLLYVPPNDANTPTTATTITWLGLGNVIVPAWASTAFVQLAIHGLSEVGTGQNTTLQLKIGSGGGYTRRVLGTGVAGQNFNYSINDKLLSIPTGTQAVTIAATWVSGSANSYRAIAFNTTVSALFFFA
jgi:hypothetical protein